MNKEESLQAIRDARDAHISQIDKIKALLNAEELQDPTAVSHEKCTFGFWLYSGSNHIEDILGAQFYQKLERLHEQWHSEYSRIFNIFFVNRKTNFFTKAFGHSPLDEKELDKVKLYYSELQSTTESILATLASSERRIQALNKSKFF